MNLQYNIELNDNQIPFFEAVSKNKIVVDSGTWRSGKSFELCLFAIQRMAKYHGIRQFMGRKTLTSLKETTFLKFQEVLTNGKDYERSEKYGRDIYNGFGLDEDKDFIVNRSGKPTITFPNGSVCVFGDLDINNIGKWLSAEYSDILIDEAQEITKLAFEKIKSRQTQKIIQNQSNGTRESKFLMGMNPPECADQHWAHEKFRSENKIKNSHIIYSELTKNKDNLPDNYIEEMYDSVDKRTADIYLKGLWVPINTNVVYADYLFPQDDQGNYIDGGNIKSMEYNPHLETFFSMDFGWTHDMSIGFWQYDRNRDEFYRLYEFVANHVKPYNYCELLAGKKITHNGKDHQFPCSAQGCKIITGSEVKQSRQEADGFNNKSLMEKHLKSMGINPDIRVVSPGVVKSVQNVRSHILTASGKRRIFIHPRCKRFIQDSTVYHYQVDKENKVIGEIPLDDGITDHTQDETRYFIWFVKPIRNGRVWSSSR